MFLENILIKEIEKKNVLICSHNQFLKILYFRLLDEPIEKNGICVAVMASHQKASLRFFFVCDVGNGVCKVHSHVFFSCLVDAG